MVKFFNDFFEFCLPRNIGEIKWSNLTTAAYFSFLGGSEPWVSWELRAIVTNDSIGNYSLHQCKEESPKNAKVWFAELPWWWELWYCWWLKSYTTWDVWNPINNGINYLSTGAGFQPSTGVVVVSCRVKRGFMAEGNPNNHTWSPRPLSLAFGMKKMLEHLWTRLMMPLFGIF